MRLCVTSLWINVTMKWETCSSKQEVLCFGLKKLLNKNVLISVVLQDFLRTVFKVSALSCSFIHFVHISNVGENTEVKADYSFHTRHLWDYKNKKLFLF